MRNFFERIKQKLRQRGRRKQVTKAKDKGLRKAVILLSNLLDQLEGISKHLCKCRTVNNGIFPFTVLNDIVGQVDKVEPVWGFSCQRKERH